MSAKTALKYTSAAIAIVALAASLILAYSPTQAQNTQDSDDLAGFVALIQYIRSTPTPSDVKADNLPILTILDTNLSNIYITGFITPFTGETPEQVKARLESVPEQDRFTAVMVESYRLASDPLLLDIIHQLLPLYYVDFFTMTDLGGASDFLKKAEIERLADAFDSTNYAIPAPSATQTPGATSPSTRGPSNVDSDDLAAFAAVIQYIRSTPTPSDVKANNLPILSILDTNLSNIYITGFITPFTGETPEQVKARLESVPEQDRFTAVMVESYRLASDPLLLDIIHQLLPLYYVDFFTTTDLGGASDFLKKAEIGSLADAFDSTDYAIPAPSATEPPDTGSTEMDRAALVALYNATDGENWRWNFNWLTDEPLSEWHGVDTDDDGRVTSLSLWENQLSGPIPPELGNLTKLEYLSLARNQLSGSIPPELGSLSRLEYLSLTRNQLSGSIPPELGNLSRVKILSLSGNQLNGDIPSELGKLANLTQLWLWGNDLSGSIPPKLGDLSKLEILSLQNNGLTGNIPPELGKLANMTDLFLAGNSLRGDIPSELGSLSNLEFLSLAGNNFTGCIPNALGDAWSNDLSELGLSFCALHASDPADRAILEAFYNATDGPNWSTTTNWLTNQPMGLWYGVATDSDGRVTALNLVNNQLSGNIPTQLGNLNKLEYLRLVANELSGSIPSSLGNLTNLERLYLFSNQLTGKIPSSLGNLTDLTQLYLDRNQLDGEVPPSLGNLASLRDLDISENRLSGSLPQELTKLTELVNFYFSGNPRLCAPDEEAFQTWLRGIDYWFGNSCAALADRAVLETLYHATDGPNWTNNENWLSDRTLWEWHGVFADWETGRVESLSLGGNNLSGSIPPELGNLTDLKHLYLWDNQLSGSIPPELGKLTKLEGLQLHNNHLTGPLPQTLISITGLERFDFGDNDGLCAPTDEAFTTWLQAIPEWSGPDCEQVEAIASDRAALVALYNATDGPNWSTSTNWLSDKPLRDWYLVGTDELGRVDWLGLDNNGLSGSIPSELGDLTNLGTLGLQGNSLTGNIPTELGNLTNLTWLSLDSNQLSGPIPTELGNLTNLGTLELGSNQLDGNIPTELGNLTNLTVLGLGNNQLEGSIPSDLGNLTNLESLGLSENRLSGPIPSELGDLSRLTYLNLHSNQLEDEIPTELGNLADLETLLLNNNQLTGAIPADLGNLTNLERLEVHDNNLTGDIPSELGDLSNLERLYLSGNQLTGCVPDALESVPDNDFDELGLDFCTQ